MPNLALKPHTMKNLIKSLAFVCLLSIFSCTKVIYSHEEVMGRYKTKEDITKKLGVPDEKRTGVDFEEWLYQYDHRNNSTDKDAGIKTINVTEFGRHKKYIIFSMGSAGNVLSWKAEGVDFTEKRNAPGKTIGLIAGVAGFIALVAWLASNINPFPNGIQITL